MYFCLVPGRLFHNTKDDYGVMNFSSSHYFIGDPTMKNVQRIDGYMDAEDSKCKSALYYTEYGNTERKRLATGITDTRATQSS